VKPFYLILLAIASAVLMALAQNYSWAAAGVLIGLVPLMLALAEGSFLALWLRVAVFYSVYAVLTLYWIGLSGGGTVWLIPVSIAYSWIFLAIPAFAAWTARGRAERLLLLAPAWMMGEVLARMTLFRINWIVLGQPLADLPLAAQTAAIAGPEATTFVAVAANAGLACLLLRRNRTGLQWGIGIVGGTLVLTLLFGWLQLRTAPSGSDALRVGIVQPMNSQRTAWTPLSRGPILDKMNALIDRAGRPVPDLIVLPEWAVVGSLRHDPVLANFATGAVRRTHVPVLLGAGDFEAGRYYNAATLIATDGRVLTYRKTRLVPFVEYTPAVVPLRTVEWVRFSPGENATTIPLAPGEVLGVMICLEDTLPDEARDFANGGATVLAALVNTADFTGTAESLQHLRRARLTAIAVGLPMFRAANSGISCALDSSGRVLDTLPAERPAAEVIGVPQDARPTLYRWIGDWPVALVLGAILAGSAAAIQRFDRYTQ